MNLRRIGGMNKYLLLSIYGMLFSISFVCFLSSLAKSSPIDSIVCLVSMAVVSIIYWRMYNEL